MPGSGKSTIGQRLAQHFGLRFVDTDLLLEQAENMPIQSIVDKRGLKYFMRLEAKILNSISLTGHVIATGGSAVYSESAMNYLSEISTRVYLYISLGSMMKRLTNAETRGLVKLPQHPLPRLYREREALCNAAADIQFDNNRPISALRIEQLQRQIIEFENA